MGMTTSSTAVAEACFPVGVLPALAQGGLEETLHRYLLKNTQGSSGVTSPSSAKCSLGLLREQGIPKTGGTRILNKT